MGIDTLIKELLQILKKEVQSLNTVSELLILEEKSLIDFDIKSLSEHIEKQEDVYSSIACLEKSRKDVLEKIGEKTGVEPETLCVSKLSEMIDNPLRKQLAETRHVLDTVYADINLKKTSNTMLIRQGIMFVESDIDIILRAFGKTEPEKPVYSSKAVTDKPSRSYRIDGRM